MTEQPDKLKETIAKFNSAVEATSSIVIKNFGANSWAIKPAWPKVLAGIQKRPIRVEAEFTGKQYNENASTFELELTRALFPLNLGADPGKIVTNARRRQSDGEEREEDRKARVVFLDIESDLLSPENLQIVIGKARDAKEKGISARQPSLKSLHREKPERAGLIERVRNFFSRGGGKD